MTLLLSDSSLKNVESLTSCFPRRLLPSFETRKDLGYNNIRTRCGIIVSTVSGRTHYDASKFTFLCASLSWFSLLVWRLTLSNSTKTTLTGEHIERFLTTIVAKVKPRSGHGVPSEGFLPAGLGCLCNSLIFRLPPLAPRSDSNSGVARRSNKEGTIDQRTPRGRRSGLGSFWWRQWPRHCLKAHWLGAHGRGMWLYRKSRQFCYVHLCAAVSGISTAVHMMTNASRSWPGKI